MIISSKRKNSINSHKAKITTIRDKQHFCNDELQKYIVLI